MAQAGYTPIQLYYSTTASAAPSSGNLANGELAINITDGKLYYKDNGGTVRVLAGTGGTGVVAGSNTQVQFNNNGVFGASSGLTFDGTTLTANALTVSNAVTLSGGTANGVAYLNGSKVLTTGSALTFDGSTFGLTGNQTVSGYINLTTTTGQAIYFGGTSSALALYGDKSTNTLSIYTSGVAQVKVDGSGNLGLGVTPSAWGGTNTKALDISLWTSLANGNAFGSALTFNGYYNGTNWIYKQNNSAAKYETDGAHRWYVAPSGTAGNAISFTQAMTLDASGNLLVGATSGSSKLVVGSSSGNVTTPTAIQMDNTYGTAAFDKLKFYLFKGASESYGFGLGSLAEVQYWAGSSSTGAHVWYTSQTERARIDSSGNLLVGVTSAAAQGGLTIYPTGSSGGPLLVWNRASTTNTTTAADFRNAGTSVGNISFNNTSTSYVTSSDYRLKENIQPMTGALAKVQALKPCTYKWKADGSDGEGFIAHELAEVVPQCVTGEKDAVDADGNPQYQGIDTSFLVATLTAAIQEQQAIINQINAKVEAQAAEIAALKGN